MPLANIVIYSMIIINLLLIYHYFKSTCKISSIDKMINEESSRGNTIEKYNVQDTRGRIHTVSKQQDGTIMKNSEKFKSTKYCSLNEAIDSIISS